MIPKKSLNPFNRFSRYFDEQEQRLVFRAIVIGIVVWAIIYSLKVAVHWLFHEMLHEVEASASLFLVFVPLVLGGLIMAAFARYGTSTIHYRDEDDRIHPLVDVKGDGLERAIALYFTSEPTLEQTLLGKEGVDVRWDLPTFSLALRKFLATLVTLGSGGSGGLEASVALIGESVAAGLFKPRKPMAPMAHGEANRNVGVLSTFWQWWQSSDPDDLQTAQLGGIAAAVATLLGAPFAAAFFAAEVMYRRRPLIEKLVYSLIPALIAFFLTDIVSGGESAIFRVEQRIVPPTEGRYYLLLVLMSFVIAVVEYYFVRLRTTITQLFDRFSPNVWVRHVAGALIVGGIALAVTLGSGGAYGLDLVLGPGESGIDLALSGELVWGIALVALVTKMLATLVTIGSGGSAGLLVPSLYLGTMVAAAFASVVGDYPAMVLIVPAMTASLVAIVNVPLAAILFVVEVFGSAYMIPALVTLVAAMILTHDNSIYRPQRDQAGKRQILPGYGVRRVVVPAGWQGRSLIELDVRKQFGITVIGLLERHAHEDHWHHQVRLEPPPDLPLEAGDIMVVLGEEGKLDELERSLRN